MKKIKLKNILILIFAGVSLLTSVTYFFNFYRRMRKDIENRPKFIILEKDSLNYFDTNGRLHTIQLKEEKTHKVYFWATWCKPCLIKFDSINSKNLGTENYLFITFESNDSFVNFAKLKNYNFPIYRADSTNFIFNTKIIKYYPTTIKVKKDSAFF